MWAEAFDCRQPAMPAIKQFVQMSLVVADANIRDRHGITFPHSRVARLRSPGDGSLDACPRPFPDKGSFKLGKRTKHLGHKHALRARRVDRVVDRTEVCALSSQGLDDLQQMRQRTSQAVNPYDQQGIALPRPSECTC